MGENENKYSSLEEKLGYSFKNHGLLKRALIHSSYIRGDENDPIDNERMEFLGDAVLELCVSEALYLRDTKAQEGALTRLRARLVCEGSLFSAAERIGLPKWLLLGHSEEATGGRRKASIVADAMEAVICAVYLDGGYGAAKNVVMKNIMTAEALTRVYRSSDDYKTRLQEYVQQTRNGQKPVYEVTGEQGPEHKKQFTVQVLVEGEVLGLGEGGSKQAAGQAAAKAALCVLGRLNETHQA